MIQIIRKDYTAEDYRRLGEKCITHYYNRYYPFDEGKTLGLEEYIYFPLEEEKGNQVRAAKRLGINRNTLRKKMKDLQIIPRVVTG
jgi:DNA-binding NtrC family response regulator